MKNYKTTQNFLGLVASAMLLSSCGLMGSRNSGIVISSDPKAQVVLSDGLNAVGKPLGTTPLKVKFSELSSDELVYLKFSSEGYESYQLILPKQWSRGEINIKLNKIKAGN